jgi:triosephosphate isomerase
MRSRRHKIVAGNWKMHGSREFVVSYVRELQAQTLPEDVTLVVFPPTAYLGLFAQRLQDAGLAEQVHLGAQDLSPQPQGAFTGETSASMVSDLGGRWALVGHSERRQHQAETSDLVAAKALAALNARLTPVICVGESEAEREAGKAEQVVAAQLAPVAASLGAGLASCVIAYEPVWAIGTGRTATAEIAQSMHATIREQLTGWCGEAAAGVRLLYGGSVKGRNAAELFAQTDIDGGLIGGASLDVTEFASIIAAASAGVD